MIDELRTEGASREAAYQHGGWDSSMGRYIDVDLDAQFARLFDNNGEVIWESAFVSGDTYEGHSTVTGLFTIYSMQTNAVLVGMDYDNDGNPDYESFVNYWMPFYGGYGLHDATWRSHFGGDYFAYDGSHGCVNLPYSKAAELYSMTYVGEQVYVHW
jgi:lipoprotein-anchoring transpeptidase ErfK/SrfK